MSKRFGKDRKLDEKRMRLAKGFECRCPECGGKCDYALSYDGKEELPSAIRLECSECGRSIAQRKPGGGGFTVGDDRVPYYPRARDNSATAFHRFNPKAYPDERSATEAELAVTCRFKMMLDDAYPCLSSEYDERLMRLLRKGYDLGVEGYNDMYIARIIEDAASDGIDPEPECIGIVDGSSMHDLISIIRSYGGIIPSFGTGTAVRNRAKERLLERARAVRCDSIEDAEDIYSACTVIAEDVDRGTVKDLLSRSLTYLRGLGYSDEREELMTKVYLAYAWSLDKGDELDSVIDYVDAKRDRLGIDYLVASNAYFEKMFDGGTRDDKLLEMMEHSIGILEECIEADGQDGRYSRLMAKTLYRRFLLKGSVEDVVAAVRCATSSFFIYDLKELTEVFAEFFSNRDIDDRTKNDILRRLKSKGVTIISTDITKDDGTVECTMDVFTKDEIVTYKCSLKKGRRISRGIA